MIKVLIVEDDPMVADINKQFIESFKDMRVVKICVNGQDAFDFLNSNHVDLMILDLYLPQFDGLELLSKINTQGRHIDTIMITAASDNFSIQKALHYSVSDFLIKPFTIDRLHSALERFVNQRNILLKHTTLEQIHVDDIFNQKTNFKHGQLTKGLQIETLDSITNFLSIHKDRFVSIEDIASHLKLSKVTIRKYMNHLLDNHQVVSKLDYLTQGRPSVLYRWIK